MKNSSPTSKREQKKRLDTKAIRKQREWLSSSLRFLAQVRDFREHPPDVKALLKAYGIRLPKKREKLTKGLPIPSNGIPFVTLLRHAPEVARLFLEYSDSNAELLEHEIRETYASAQQRFLRALSCQENDDAMEILARFGPRLLAKDPLDPGPALGTLDRRWRDFWTVGEEHRQELHSYGITDELIAETQKRERAGRRAFFAAVGNALGLFMRLKFAPIVILSYSAPEKIQNFQEVL